MKFNFSRIQSVLLALWVGGIFAVGYLVAPVLFAMLPDRSVAGLVAGHLFALSAVAGMYIGSVLLVSWLVDGMPLRRVWWLLPLWLVAEWIGRFTSLPAIIPTSRSS